jgi:hypothetical protein
MLPIPRLDEPALCCVFSPLVFIVSNKDFAISRNAENRTRIGLRANANKQKNQYATEKIHPCTKSNYRRHLVVAQLDEAGTHVDVC